MLGPIASTSLLPTTASSAPQAGVGPVSAPFPAPECERGTATEACPRSELVPDAQQTSGGFGRWLAQPAEKLTQTRQDVERLLDRFASSPLDPHAPGSVAEVQKQNLELLGLQMRMSEAALGVELMSKTLEMGTNGINTLARTQT